MKRIVLIFFVLLLSMSMVLGANCNEDRQCTTLTGETGCVNQWVGIVDTYEKDYSSEHLLVDGSYNPYTQYLRNIISTEYDVIALSDDTNFDITLGRAKLNIDVSSDKMTMEVMDFGEPAYYELDVATGIKYYTFNTNTEYKISMERDGFDIIVKINNAPVWTFDYSQHKVDAPIELSDSDSIYYGNTNGYIYAFKMFEGTQYRLTSSGTSLIVNEGQIELTYFQKKDEGYYQPRFNYKNYFRGQDYTEYLLCGRAIVLQREVSADYPNGVVSGQAFDDADNVEISGNLVTITNGGNSVDFEFVPEKGGFLSEFPHSVIAFFRALAK